MTTHKAPLRRALSLLVASALGGVILSVAPVTTAPAEAATSVTPISASKATEYTVGIWNLCNDKCASTATPAHQRLPHVSQRADKIAKAVKASGVSILAAQEFKPKEDNNGPSLVAELGSGWKVAAGSVENITTVYDTRVWSDKDAKGKSLKSGYIQNATSGTKKKTPYHQLRNLKSGKTVLFVNIHLHWGDPSGTGQAEKVVAHRTSQATKIVTEAAKIAPASETVYLGDLNSMYERPDFNDLPTLKVFENAGHKPLHFNKKGEAPYRGLASVNQFVDWRVGGVIDHMFAPNTANYGVQHMWSDSSVSDHNMVYTTIDLGSTAGGQPSPTPDPIKHPGGYPNPIPTNLRATSTTDTSMTLAWDSLPGVSKYRIQYSTKSNMGSAKYATFTATSGTIKSLKKNTIYYVRVVAVHPKTEAKISEYTAKPYVTVRTSAGASTPAPIKHPGGYPNPIPENLKASRTTNSSMTLTWNAVPGVSKYRIQYSTKSNMGSAKYATFTATSGTISGLKANTVYYVRVVAVHPTTEAKISDYTQTPYPTVRTAASGSVTPQPAPEPAPVDPGAKHPGGYANPIPTNLHAVSSTTSSMTLAWNAVAGVSHYRIQYSTKANMSGAKYETFTATRGTITGLKNNTNYYVRVVAAHPTTGAKISEYTATPYPTARTGNGSVHWGGYSFPIPSDFSVTATSKNAISMSWSPVAGISKYRIQYATKSSMSGAKYATFNSTRGTITGLSANTTYYVRVVAIHPTTEAKLSDYTQKPYPTGKTTR